MSTKRFTFEEVRVGCVFTIYGKEHIFTKKIPYNGGYEDGYIFEYKEIKSGREYKYFFSKKDYFRNFKLVKNGPENNDFDILDYI